MLDTITHTYICIYIHIHTHNIHIYIYIYIYIYPFGFLSNISIALRFWHSFYLSLVILLTIYKSLFSSPTPFLSFSLFPSLLQNFQDIQGRFEVFFLFCRCMLLDITWIIFYNYFLRLYKKK